MCQELLLHSPITIPASLRGKVWQKQRDKGRRERQRKEEIEEEIYMQQLTEG